jgi:hypothetical protein
MFVIFATGCQVNKASYVGQAANIGFARNAITSIKTEVVSDFVTISSNKSVS